jgi:hypothetical protein
MLVHAKVDIRVTGARPLTVTGAAAVLRIVEITGDANPQIVHFFSVSSGKPLKLDEQHYLQFDADLAPGIYTGPGTYKLTADKTVANGQQTSLSSAAYIQFLDLRPLPAGPKFDRLVEPCTLSMTAAGDSGSVTCPKLGSADGKTVALTWSWVRT